MPKTLAFQAREVYNHRVVKEINRREALTFAGAVTAAFGLGLLGLDHFLGNKNAQTSENLQKVGIEKIDPNINLEVVKAIFRENSAAAKERYLYELNPEELARLAQLTGLESIEVLTYLSRRSSPGEFLRYTWVIPNFNKENQLCELTLSLPISDSKPPTDALMGTIIYAQVFGWAMKSRPERAKELGVIYDEVIDTTPPERYPLHFNRPSLYPERLINVFLPSGQFIPDPSARSNPV